MSSERSHDDSYTEGPPANFFIGKDQRPEDLPNALESPPPQCRVAMSCVFSSDTMRNIQRQRLDDSDEDGELLKAFEPSFKH